MCLEDGFDSWNLNFKKRHSKTLENLLDDPIEVSEKETNFLNEMQTPKSLKDDDASNERLPSNKKNDDYMVALDMKINMLFCDKRRKNIRGIKSYTTKFFIDLLRDSKYLEMLYRPKSFSIKTDIQYWVETMINKIEHLNFNIPQSSAIIIQKLRESYMNFKCEICGKNYASSSNLSRHKKIHRMLVLYHHDEFQNNPPALGSTLFLRCSLCDKNYNNQPALAMHLLTHDKENKRHQCTMCNKAFSRLWLLKGHMRSHTGEKPYPCLKCSKSFADRSNLRAHLQTHYSVKQFECHMCSKSFALKSYLHKHKEICYKKP
ncbi:unnamed protein product [Gordionus sp. m RMFG-2023]|uniref:zinc finger protein 583-like n=1 Tax=Gordionus sp. m RMFG-2023 TaxID=3053472 RepID=UPI0030DEB02B